MSTHEPTLQGQLLEWVYDLENEAPGGHVDLTPFALDHDLDGPAIFGLLGRCTTQGLLDDTHSTYGTAMASLTPRGREWVEGRRARRMDVGLRAKTARTHLLTWLYKRASEGRRSIDVEGILKDGASYYEGERFTEREVDKAAAALRERGLIRGIMTAHHDGPIRADLTADGERCVEDYAGNVAEFEKAKLGGNVINNFRDNKGIIASNSPGAHMSVTNNEAAQAEEVQRWVDSYRRERPTLQLTVEAGEELEEIAAELEGQAKTNALDVPRARGGLQRAREILNSPVAAGTAANMLAAYAMHVLSTLN